MSQQFTAKEVEEHKTVENGLYIIIDGGVYKMDSWSPSPLSTQPYLTADSFCG